MAESNELEATAEYWADRIRPHLEQTVSGILAAGRELIQAKASLPHGSFGPLLDTLGLQRQHAYRFMRVASHPVLSDVSPGIHLPSSVTVLDELTRWPDDELADALESGEIGPSTTRAEAKAMRPPADDGPLFSPGEAEAIEDELRDAYGDDVTPEQVDEAVAENVESKRVPKPPTKPDLGGGVSHPARYSAELLPLFAELLGAYCTTGCEVLDPFAGTGRIHELQPEWDTYGIEIEPEWADLHGSTIEGDALDLPFSSSSFDAVVTSPTYGNRLADSHNASDPERRRSYTHDLGRDLSSSNSGILHWRTTKPGDGATGSESYRRFHEVAWAEAVRVLKPDGVFILNMKDHWRDGDLQPVTAWHCYELGRLGLAFVESRVVQTRNLRQGSNSNLREQEQVHVFRKVLS